MELVAPADLRAAFDRIGRDFSAPLEADAVAFAEAAPAATPKAEEDDLRVSSIRVRCRARVRRVFSSEMACCSEEEPARRGRGGGCQGKTTGVPWMRQEKCAAEVGGRGFLPIGLPGEGGGGQLLAAVGLPTRNGQREASNAAKRYLHRTRKRYTPLPRHTHLTLSRDV